MYFVYILLFYFFSDKVPQIVKDAIPKHIKALYKAHKATYAKDYAYKLIPIPNKIPSAPAPATAVPNALSRSSRAGRQAWNSPYAKGSQSRTRRRKVRPPPVRMTYTMPAYASKYKSYAPVYKKRPRYPPTRLAPTPARFPPKYRMPIHNNVIEPVEDYSDEEIMPEVIEDEPLVMETMGASYTGNALPLMSGHMGQTMGMMEPGQSKS